MDSRLLYFGLGVASVWAFHRFVKPLKGKNGA